MPPQNQNYPPNAPQPNKPNTQYDFFMNPPKPKRSVLSFGGNSQTSRIIIVVVGIILLIIIASVISSTFFSDKTTPLFVKVVQDQNEIARVSGSAVINAEAASTKQFAITTKLSANSAQSSLLTFLKSHGTKVGAKQLGSTKNPQTDAMLATAKSASSYDETYYSLIKTQLQTYASDLQTAYNHTHNTQLRSQLNQYYSGTQLLLGQIAVNAPS